MLKALVNALNKQDTVCKLFVTFFKHELKGKGRRKCTEETIKNAVYSMRVPLSTDSLPQLLSLKRIYWTNNDKCLFNLNLTMMKRIRINKGYVGLVFRQNDYLRVLTEGKHWISLYEKVGHYNLAKPFSAPVELNLLLQDEKLAELLTVVEVKDNEIVLQAIDGNFKNVLLPGKYAFWNGVVKYTFTKVDLDKVEIDKSISKSILERRELLSYIRVFVVQSFEKGMLFIDGQFVKELGTGTYFFWKNATPIKVETVDLRQRQMEMAGQEMLTKDKAALRINFMAQFKVIHIYKALVDNKDFEKQLYILLQLALREFVGTFSLDELLEKKDEMANYVLKVIANKAEALGVEVKDCGVRDMILPGEVKDIMNQVLIAQKKAQANVIMRREETASTRSLLNTAKLMEDNAMLYKLKEMEYVEKIAEKIGEITVAGNGQIIDQLKSIFTPEK